MLVVMMILGRHIIFLLVALVFLFEFIDLLEDLALILTALPIGIAAHVLLTIGGLHL